MLAVRALAASSKPAFPSAGGPAASPFGAASSAPKARAAPSRPSHPARSARGQVLRREIAADEPRLGRAQAAAPKVNQAAASQAKGGFEFPKPTLAQVRSLSCHASVAAPLCLQKGCRAHSAFRLP